MVNDLVPSIASDPAYGAVAVTPSDTVNLKGDGTPCRGLYVGVTGDIKMMMADGSIVTRKNVPVGEWPWRIKRIYATDTSAQEMIADF